MAAEIYIGVPKPEYESITGNNINQYFTVDNGSYFFETIKSGDGLLDDGSGIFISNNTGVPYSIATTTLTALTNMDISFIYTYSTETDKDKFTLTVGDTVVEDGVSGPTTTKTYTGSLSMGQKIIFKFQKNSYDADLGTTIDDTCSFSNMRKINEPGSVSIKKVKEIYIGVGVDGVPKKIKEVYIGVGNGIKRTW